MFLFCWKCHYLQAGPSTERNFSSVLFNNSKLEYGIDVWVNFFRLLNVGINRTSLLFFCLFDIFDERNVKPTAALSSTSSTFTLKQHVINKVLLHCSSVAVRWMYTGRNTETSRKCLRFDGCVCVCVWTVVTLLFLSCFCKFSVDPIPYVFSILCKLLYLVSSVCFPRFPGSNGYNRDGGERRAHSISPQTWKAVVILDEHGHLRSVFSATRSVRLPVCQSLNTNRRLQLPDPHMGTTGTVCSSVLRQCDSITDSMASCYWGIPLQVCY